MTKKQLLQSVCTLAVIVVLLSVASWILKVKDSDIEYAAFYDNSKDIDVLFFGSSIVHYGIYPMELWNKYGMTSYNMGNNSERLYMTYYTLKNSLDYSAPQVVVVDLGGLAWAGQTSDGTLKDHSFLDSVPLSRTKLESIYEIFEKGRRLEFIFPATVYHERWEEVRIQDITANKSSTFGADILTHTEKLEKPTGERLDESRYDSPESEETTLLKINELCEERNIKLILIFMPYEIRGGDQKLREYAYNFALENQIAYYDFQDIPVIDWANDFADESHLNYKGANTFTDYLGEFLKKQFQIQDHRGDAEYEQWPAYYNRYREYCDELGL